MKILLIHHLDLDGISILVLARHFNDQVPEYKRFTQMIGLDYEFELEPKNCELIESFECVVFADITPGLEYYEKLISLGILVFVFDHHEGSLYLKGRPGVFHDTARCGSKIFFEDWYQFPRVKQVVSQYVELVNAYDIWLETSPLFSEAQNLNRVMYKYAFWSIDEVGERYYRFINSTLKKFEKASEWFWTGEESRFIDEAIKKEDECYADAIKKLKVRRDNHGHLFGISILSAKISIVAHRLLTQTTLGDQLSYLIFINSYKTEWGKLSGRCRKGKFLVNRLKALNGHPEAAGGDGLTDAEARELYSNPNLCLSLEGDEGDSLFGEAEPVEISWKPKTEALFPSYSIQYTRK